MLKKILIVSLFLLCIAVPTAWADESNSLSIELQLDQSTVVINGESTIVEPPYRSGDTTLVPLRVVTSAFGAVLQWDGATQTIVLKYGSKQLKLVIGSTKAEVNGAINELPAMT